MIRTANIRALKDRLSAYLRDVQRGDVILVTDRGRVVAEIRQPSVATSPADPADAHVRRLVEEGELRLGLPNTSLAYRRPGLSLPEHTIDETLDWTRGNR